MMEYSAQGTAYTNIALTKYWGKQDSKLNTPTTNSVGLTLDTFSTTTNISFSNKNKTDVFVLDGVEQNSNKVSKVLNFVRDKYRVDLFANVNSENNVPYSAGFASSASAFAALAIAINEALELNLNPSEISEIARIGSGSAARSIFGGFSLWHNQPPYQAESILDTDAIDFDIQIVDIISETTVKTVSSTDGMRLAQTSLNYSNWIEQSALDTKNMLQAIKNSDLEQIGLIAEKNALFMHELNRTAENPFDYFTQETRDIIETIQKKRRSGSLVFATIDAGANVKVIADAAGVIEMKNTFKDKKTLVQKPGIGAFNG